MVEDFEFSWNAGAVVYLSKDKFKSLAEWREYFWSALLKAGEVNLQFRTDV